MRLYGLAAATDASALLELVLSDRTILVHFKRGAPELIDSTHPHDALPAFLMAQGLATPAQLEQAEAQKGRFGGELLPALFGLGLVSPNLVFQQIAERATAILFRALSAEQGTFTFRAQELPPHKSLPLGNRWALYLEQLRRIAPADVRRRMAGFMGLPVMRSGGAVAAADLKLQPQEARALQFFDGVRSLNQLVGDHPMEADVLVRVAWMLRELDLVSFDGTPAPPASPATVAPPPVVPSVAARAMAPPSAPSFIAAPVAPPGAPQAHRPLVARTVLRVAEPSAPPTIRATMAGGPVPVQPPPRQAVPPPERRGSGGAASPAGGPRPSTAPPSASSARPEGTASSLSGVAKAPTPPPGVVPTNDIAQLTALLERARKQTYFELLNLSREADATAVKAAYFRLAKVFHPDTVPPGSSEALVRVKADLFALIGEAHRTLSDSRLKQDYIAEIDSGSQGEKVDVAQLLLAEELFQRGRMLVKARKWAEAVKVLNEAIAANGQEGEYFGWRGFARFFLHEDKAKGHPLALRDMGYALKLNPNAAAIHYFQGYLWKMMGDFARAKTYFKRCVELDPRHIDAQRELRMMK